MTLYPIVSLMISYDSTRAIAVTKKDDRCSYINMYSLESYRLTFEEEIGGREDGFIKVKDIEQNDEGTGFACIYFDDGLWFLRTFGKKTRT